MTEHGFLYLVWQGNSGLGRLFTLLLLGLGAVAGWIAMRHRQRYAHREMGALKAVRTELREALQRDQAQAEAEAQEGKEPRTPAPVDVHSLCERVDRRSIIGDRLAELARMKQARVRVQVEALQQMTVMRENARSGLAFPGYAVDLCTMGGMLGTFIGLCMMLLQMQGVMPGDGAPAADGFAQASASLGSIIASKKTAFVTTLVGLFCAIVVSALNFLLVRAQSAFYDELERFTVAELLPATVPAVEDETALEKLSLQLAESFATLTDLSRLQERNAERQTGMHEALGTTVESIRRLALQAAARGPEAEESGAALAPLVQEISAASAAMVRTADSVERSLRRAETDRAVRVPERPAGWQALGTQLLGFMADLVGEMRRNPLLVVGVAVVLVIVIW
ncbi:MAG TPA: MotA/TolQ/ExbB proton channel family protein [Longimicrobium sp.]|jgi:hypothetical protein